MTATYPVRIQQRLYGPRQTLSSTQLDRTSQKESLRTFLYRETRVYLSAFRHDAEFVIQSGQSSPYSRQSAKSSFPRQDSAAVAVCTLVESSSVHHRGRCLARYVCLSHDQEKKLETRLEWVVGAGHAPFRIH